MGGLACVGLAVFQGIMVPSAGIITLVWLSIGGALFVGLFAGRARVIDASSTAFDPELVTLRGHTPLVLAPVANPQNAAAMIALADALVPADIGRVLMQTVAVVPVDWQPDEDPAPIEKSQAVLREVLRASAKELIPVEVLTTVAQRPMEEIARVARLHRCDSVLLGLSEFLQDGQVSHLESLLGAVDANVVVLRSRKDWRLAEAKRILIPVAGRGGHEHLRAILLGSLMRAGQRQVTYLRILPTNVSLEEVRRAQRDLARIASDEAPQPCAVEVTCSDNALLTVAERAERSDLVILGSQRLGRRKKFFGEFTREVALLVTCPIIVISRRG
jgi:nucleotide-binding universal stress UspA family protein